MPREKEDINEMKEEVETESVPTPSRKRGRTDEVGVMPQLKKIKPNPHIEASEALTENDYYRLSYSLFPQISWWPIVDQAYLQKSDLILKSINQVCGTTFSSIDEIDEAKYPIFLAQVLGFLTKQSNQSINETELNAYIKILFAHYLPVYELEDVYLDRDEALKALVQKMTESQKNYFNQIKDAFLSGQKKSIEKVGFVFNGFELMEALKVEAISNLSSATDLQNRAQKVQLAINTLNHMSDAKIFPDYASPLIRTIAFSDINHFIKQYPKSEIKFIDFNQIQNVSNIFKPYAIFKNTSENLSYQYITYFNAIAENYNTMMASVKSLDSTEKHEILHEVSVDSIYNKPFNTSITEVLKEADNEIERYFRKKIITDDNQTFDDTIINLKKFVARSAAAHDISIKVDCKKVGNTINKTKILNIFRARYENAFNGGEFFLNKQETEDFIESISRKQSSTIEYHYVANLNNEEFTINLPEINASDLDESLRNRLRFYQIKNLAKRTVQNKTSIDDQIIQDALSFLQNHSPNASIYTEEETKIFRGLCFVYLSQQASPNSQENLNQYDCILDKLLLAHVEVAAFYSNAIDLGINVNLLDSLNETTQNIEVFLEKQKTVNEEAEDVFLNERFAITLSKYIAKLDAMLRVAQQPEQPFQSNLMDNQEPLLTRLINAIDYCSASMSVFLPNDEMQSSELKQTILKTYQENYDRTIDDYYQWFENSYKAHQKAEQMESMDEEPTQVVNFDQPIMDEYGQILLAGAQEIHAEFILTSFQLLDKIYAPMAVMTQALLEGKLNFNKEGESNNAKKFLLKYSSTVSQASSQPEEDEDEVQILSEKSAEEKEMPSHK